jgi:uncharacterized cupredoxin-like copper-binding protein
MTARRVVIVAAAAIVVILAVTGIHYFVLPPPGGSTTVTVVVTAGHQFAPANFTVTEGQHVTIVFDNTDDGQHEFQIGAFSVSTGIVQGGQTVRVNFVPHKVGMFIVDQPCPIVLGPAFPPCSGMEGYVTVLPP